MICWAVTPIVFDAAFVDDDGSSLVVDASLFRIEQVLLSRCTENGKSNVCEILECTLSANCDQSE